jgi:hypothetical protein
MSDVNQAATKTLEIFNSAVEQAINLVATTAPEIAQQVLIWSGLRSFICFLIALLLATVTCKIDWKYIYKNDHLTEDVAIGLVILNIVMFMLIMLLATQSLTWIKILVAPKLYLFEYFAQYVN